MDGGPAFPYVVPDCGYGDAISVAEGLSVRDVFAKAALSGLLANPSGPIQASTQCGWSLCNCTEDQVAEYAYELADAMLRARTGGAP
jgi:hypothetical protein